MSFICKIIQLVQCTVRRELVSSVQQNQNETTISTVEGLARAEPCKKFKIEKQFLSRLLPAFLDRNVSGSEWKKLKDGAVAKDLDVDDGAAFDDDVYVEGCSWRWRAGRFREA